MKALLLTQHASSPEKISIEQTERPIPSVNRHECLIKIAASGINPSDTLAAMGYFKHAVLPRIPGRDFSGTVVEGPPHLINKTVWGTGGAAGISFDGTQAEFIKLSIDDIAESPVNLDLVTAGAQTLPYVTAYYSLVSRAHLQQNESVLVVGALGQVGSAAMSICQWKNCHVIALVRGKNAVKEATVRGWTAIDSEDADLQKKILAANHGKPVQIILNSLGNIYWETFITSLAEFGRIVTIGARENLREAKINLFDLYRANQEMIGINSVSLNFSENAKILTELKSGFETNKLKPLEVVKEMTFSKEQANEAYQTVLQGSDGKRVVIQFS